MFDISYRNDYLYNCAWKCTRRYPICKLISSRVHNVLRNNIFLFIDSGYTQTFIPRILMKINYFLRKINKNDFLLFTIYFKIKAIFNFKLISTFMYFDDG